MNEDLPHLFHHSAPQRCIFVVDTSLRMEGRNLHALNEGLHYFHGQMLKQEELGHALEVGYVTFGNGGTSVQFPQLANVCPPPTLRTQGYGSVLEGLKAAAPLLRVPEGHPSPWLIILCGPGATFPNSFEQHVEQLQWAIRLAHYPTLTLTLDEYTPPFVPGGEVAFPLQGLRFIAFFDWLVEALDFRLQCGDDLPYTTTYSWAKREALSQPVRD